MTKDDSEPAAINSPAHGRLSSIATPMRFVPSDSDKAANAIPKLRFAPKVTARRVKEDDKGTDNKAKSTKRPRVSS